MKKIMLFLLAICMICSVCRVSAQVSINTTGNPPHSSAMLDVTSDDKGILIPRMTYWDRMDITSLTEGLLVYQTDQTKGFYYYNGDSWTRLSTHLPLWTKEGHYISPAGPVGTHLKIADSSECNYGFFAQMNTGNIAGHGAYFHHMNSSYDGTGIYAKADFTGTTNLGYTRGAMIYSNSTTQDQYGLYLESKHTENTGYLKGLYNKAEYVGANSYTLYGIFSESLRNQSDQENYGIYSSATNGTNVYGIFSNASQGNFNCGVYAMGSGGTDSYGVYGQGGSWGGWYDHQSSGKMVKLAGASYAMHIQDGNEAEGKVLTSDASGYASWQSLPASVTPGGSGGQVQFNNAGSFGGTSELFWDHTNKRLGIGFSSPAARLEVDGDIRLRTTASALMIGSYDVLHAPANVNNICVGASSGPVVTGQHNAFFGFESGLSNTSGWDNTCVGYKSGRSNISGLSNTFVGSAAGHNNTAGNSNTFLGFQAGYFETGSNRLYINNNSSPLPLIYGEFDNSILKFNGRVGIQTLPAEEAALHVDHSDLYAGYFTSDFTSDETHVIHAVYEGQSTGDGVAVFAQSTPSYNENCGIGGDFLGKYMGIRAISSPGSSTGNAVAIHAMSDGTAGVRTGIYATALGGEVRYGVFGSAATQWSSYAIYCDGNGVYTGTWGALSDNRLKKNIDGLQDALGIVMQLQPKSYEFRRDEFDFINLAGGRHYGFEAQQLEEVLPELVGIAAAPMSKDKNPEMFEFKTTNLIELIPLLTKAIQEQNLLIESQGRMIRELQLEIEGLKNDQ